MSEKILIKTIDEEYDEIKKSQVKGFTRTKKGKMERVKPFSRKGDKSTIHKYGTQWVKVGDKSKDLGKKKRAMGKLLKEIDRKLKPKKSKAYADFVPDVADIVDEFRAHTDRERDDVSVDNLIEFMDKYEKDEGVKIPMTTKKAAILQIQDEEDAYNEKEKAGLYGKKNKKRKI